MTLFVPVSGVGVPPASPSTLQHARDHSKQLDRAARAIAKAKRIVVVCGAGVSVQAGIPDFRSADGLFQQLKKEHPKEGLSSGRELFDASVFHSESTASIFYKMIARLARLVEHAEPTPFHQMLKGLDDRGQLLRCYTQNIDGIEEKAGLSLGVPMPLIPKRTPRKSKKKGTQSTPDKLDGSTSALNSLSSSPSPVPTPSPTPIIDETPRCIPLHGTLKSLHCPTCGATASLSERASSFEDGSAPSCVQCSEFEHTRQLVGKRLRGVGVMRPSIVLYNEDHREGERVGDMVKRDLTGGKTKRAPPDLLLVAGTSLRVPGTKRIVKEFSKAARSGVSSGSGNGNANGESRSSTPSGGDDDRPIRTIYLNLDFPMPAREWESTFDVWVQGDVQEFVGRVKGAMKTEDGARRLREERSMARLATAGEKRKREKEEDVGTRSLESAMDASSISSVGGKRRKLVPVIQRSGGSLTTGASAFGLQLVESEPRDVFGPVVVPTVLPQQQPPHPQRSIGAVGPVEVRASVSCGVQQCRSIAYPLGGISAPSPGELWRATVLGESRREDPRPEGPSVNGPLCSCLYCA